MFKKVLHNFVLFILIFQMFFTGNVFGYNANSYKEKEEYSLRNINIYSEAIKLVNNDKEALYYISHNFVVNKDFTGKYRLFLTSKN